MRVLILGGAGFIGRHVTARLVAGGHDVMVFRRDRGAAGPADGAARAAGAGYLFGDRHRLTVHAPALRAVEPDVVIDMIASSGADARQVVEVFREVARRTVTASSMDVYRAAAVLHRLDAGPLEPVPLTEDSAVRTAPLYPAEQLQALRRIFGWLDDGYDKVAVEREARAAVDLPATVLRLPMVYGPGDPLHRFFPVIKQIQDGRATIPFEERMGRFRSPRGYVENVAAAIVLAATDERAAGRTYNVGEAEGFSEVEWARLIGRAMGWPGRIVSVPTARAPAHLGSPANLEQHWVADTSRIRRDLGYREPVPRDEAIRRTVEWERANPPAASAPA